MDTPIQPRPRKKTSNSQVRKMVRSLITSLESFQSELLVVLGDIKDLVGQIDEVSTKIDNRFGKKPKNIEKCFSKSKHSYTDLNQNHHYVNIDLIPTIQRIEKRINSKICSTQYCNKHFNVLTGKTDHSTLIETDGPISTDNDLNQSPPVVDKLENGANSIQFPMSDISNQHAGIQQEFSRSVSLPKTFKSHYFLSLRYSHSNNSNTGNNSRGINTPKAVCYAELKRNNFSNHSLSSCISDNVFKREMNSSHITGTTVKSIASSSSESVLPPDGDLYERKLDDELEHISETSDGSEIETDDSMETGSFGNLDRHSDNFDENSWMPLTLNNLTESTKSSESFVSDTPSDIVNDNIWPPSNVGDLFSNSMLARKLNVHLDTEIVH